MVVRELITGVTQATTVITCLYPQTTLQNAALAPKLQVNSQVTIFIDQALKLRRKKGVVAPTSNLYG